MPRKTITIAEVGEIRTFGDSGKSLPIKATDGLSYQCFRPRLFEHIKVGTELDCEVEEKRTEKGDNIYINRNIQDIFKDGQPVGQRQGGGGRSYGKSPETEAMIQDRMDRRTLVMQLPEYVKAGIRIPEVLEAAAIRIMWEWANLPQFSLPASAPVAPPPYAEFPQTVNATPIPPQPHQEGQGVASASKPIPGGIPRPRTSRDDAADMDAAFAGTVAGPRTFDSTLAFLNAAVKELGLTQAQIQAALGIEKGADLFGHDLSAEWRKLELCWPRQ